ncbi:MAG: hypothetical protein Q4B87_02335 [Candidatus Saccharibacteria bacterium]|nr:hypothetical protein [Candidatus Saccharibacteria bacterium]
MNVAEWIIVAILAITLLAFLVIGIILMLRMLSLTDEAQKVIIKSQDLADNANNVITNVRGMTSIGGAVQTFVDKFVEPRLREAKPFKSNNTSKGENYGKKQQ